MLKKLGRIIRDVDAAESFGEALTVIVDSVLAALDTQACSIFLLDKHRDDFVLAATQGLNPHSVGRVRIKRGEGLIGLIAERDEIINLGNAPEHPNFLKIPEIHEESFLSFLGAPIIHRGEVLGVIVVQQEVARHFDEDEETFLLTITAQLAGIFARAQDSGAIKQLFSPDVDYEGKRFRGVPGSPGVAMGRGVVVYPLADLEAVPDRETEDVLADVLLFQEALSEVRHEMSVLGEKIAETLPEEERYVFEAYIRILEDEHFIAEVITEIQSGLWVQAALRIVIKRYIHQFESMDNVYMRERAADMRDLGQRILFYLQRGDRANMMFYEKTILVGVEISAATLAEVPEGCLAGIVSVTGSSSSHVAILARALNVPAAMGVGELPYGELEGLDLVMDGFYGDVYVEPSPRLRAEFELLLHQQKSLDKGLEKLHDLLGETTDGHRVSLQVNAGLAADVGMSLTAGAEGVGLYRTEVPFMVRDCFPAGAEQKKIYRQLLSSFAPRPVTMRTLDIGGDKTLPYFPVEEDNPFLGWRGIRISLDHPDIFLVQVRAMLRANEEHKNLRIMLPMITDVSEVDRALEMIHRAHGDIVAEGHDIPMPPIGVMIEVPAAVYQAELIASRVDFLSVGTNDLTQYVLAVDRNNANVAHLYHSLHPAVLKALMMVVAGAHAQGKPVSVCGEMASDPAAAILLLAMGFDALSMNAASLPRIKWVIRTFSFVQAQHVLKKVLEKNSIEEITIVLHQALEEVGLGRLIRTRLG